MTAAADAAYWTELLHSPPQAAGTRRAEALAEGAAAALAVRLQRLEKVATDDTDLRNRWRRRAQLVAQCRLFERLAVEAGLLTDLASWCHDLADEMSARWKDATDPPPPLFPAFARG